MKNHLAIYSSIALVPLFFVATYLGFPKQEPTVRANQETRSAVKWEYGEFADLRISSAKKNECYWETGNGTVRAENYPGLIKKLGGASGYTSTDMLDLLGKQGWELVSMEEIFFREELENPDNGLSWSYPYQTIKWTLKRQVQ